MPASVQSIPYFVDSADKVPESLRSHYLELDENQGFRLAVEGAVEKPKFDEFRANNTQLLKDKAELERQLAVYRAINEDPDKLKTDFERLTKLEKRVADKDLIEKDGFEKAVEQRTLEMKSASDGQIRALSEALRRVEMERDEATKENERILIHRAITDAVLAAGVVPAAIPDILDRAQRDGWTLNEKKQVVQIRDGELMYGENVADPLTPKEWATRTLRDTAPWFFNKPEGGGATGSVVSGGLKNPWHPDNWNLTEQSSYIMKEGLAKAEALAKAVGSSVNATHPPRLN